MCEHPVGRLRELSCVAECVLVFVFLQRYRVKLAVELAGGRAASLCSSCGTPALLEKHLNRFALWAAAKPVIFKGKPELAAAAQTVLSAWCSVQQHRPCFIAAHSEDSE